MALVLTLRQGHSFYAGDERVVVSAVETALNFTLKWADHIVKVTDGMWTQLMPGVRVQAAIPRDINGHIVRVAIKAEGVLILRSDLYDKKQKFKGKCVSCKGTGQISTKSGCEKCNGHGCHQCQGTGSQVFKSKCPDCGGK